MSKNLNRRAFLGSSGAFVAGSLMASPLASYALEPRVQRI